MLVITRQKDQVIDFPECGISISFLSTTPRKVRVGIEAPRDVTIMRRELSDRMPAAAKKTDPERVVSVPMSDFRFQRHLHRIDECVEALARHFEKSPDTEARRLLIELRKTISSTDIDVAIDQGREPVLTASRRRKALLVDDNPNEAKLLAGFLRLRDIDVAIAGDGIAAMQYLEEHEEPDVVLLDMSMPRMDGPSTVRNIRESASHHSLKLFAVSGSTPEENGISVGSNGVDAWFQKPLDPELLVVSLAKDWTRQTEARQERSQDAVEKA